MKYLIFLAGIALFVGAVVCWIFYSDYADGHGLLLLFVGLVGLITMNHASGYPEPKGREGDKD